MQANFDRFWGEYPRKVGKDAALAVWRRLRPDTHTTTDIIAAVHEQAQRWDDPKFIPHPRTWLSQGRWTVLADGASHTPLDANTPVVLATDAYPAAGSLATATHVDAILTYVMEAA